MNSLLRAAFLGLYQCVSAVPAVFDVQTPTGLEGYADWIRLLEFDFGINIIIPGSCLGTYQRSIRPRVSPHAL